MNTYLLFGKYSLEALKGISRKRTIEANKIIKENGGEIIAQYMLLGENDLLFIIKFPSLEKVFKISVELNKITGISFNSVPAITVEHFDQIISQKITVK